MAAKTKKTEEKALVRKDPSEMEQWEKDLYEDAQKATEQEAGVGGGNFFSIKAGVLSYDKNPIPDNQIAVVILDSVILKTWPEYDDTKSNQTVDCYAFGRDPSTIAPYKDVKKPCAAKCVDCPNNVFGTAKGGTRKGKSCADRRRLALITAGTMNGREFAPSTEPDALKKAEVAFLHVPPTSLKDFANYVKGLKASFQRPPYAVYTLIKVRPDAKKQVAMEFTMLGAADKDAVPVLGARHREAEEKIIFPFPSASSEAAPDASPAGKKPRNKFK